MLDVLTACDLLADFTRGKSFEDYAAEARLRSAVERQLEIIGEALRVAVKHRPVLTTQITDVPAIIAFRNQLTHAYSIGDSGFTIRRSPMSRNLRDQTRSAGPCLVRLQARNRSRLHERALSIGQCLRR